MGTVGRAITGQGGTVAQNEITNRLKDILESHTIVHDGTNPINGEDEYFLSKNGNAIKVVRDENGHVVQALGGFQLENMRQNVESDARGVTTCNVTKPFEGLKNGQTYVINHLFSMKEKADLGEGRAPGAHLPQCVQHPDE